VVGVPVEAPTDVLVPLVGDTSPLLVPAATTVAWLTLVEPVCFELVAADCPVRIHSGLRCKLRLDELAAIVNLVIFQIG
jgi:hypothetical protein